MAEDAQRKRDFSYAANSNLVLRADRRKHFQNRPVGEPSGEPDSLWGRKNFSMGDRALSSANGAKKGGKGGVVDAAAKGSFSGEDPQLAAKLAAMRARASEQKQHSAVEDTKMRNVSAASLAPEDLILGAYKPRTAATKAAFAALLSAVAHEVGDAPRDVIRDAAEDVAAVLLSDAETAIQKRESVARVLGLASRSLGDAEFGDMFDLARRLTDWDTARQQQQHLLQQQQMQQHLEGEDGGGDALQDELGIAVVVDDERDGGGGEADFSDDDLLEEVADVGDGDSEGAEFLEEGVEDTDMTQQFGGTAGEDKESIAERASHHHETLEEALASGTSGRLALSVSPRDVATTPYWVQKMVSSRLNFDDPEAAQQLAEKILHVLEFSQSIRECEQSLVQLLQFNNFDLAKLFLNNRDTIVWGSKLSHAGSEDERLAIESTMRKHPKLGHVLEQLYGFADKRESLENALASSVRTRDRTVVAALNVAAPRRTLDLAALQFEDGGHTMTNRSLRLPDNAFRKEIAGAEEIHVPAPPVPPMGKDEVPVNVKKDLPVWAHPALSGIEDLNRVQSRVCDIALRSHENMLLCAPTGAGKTNVAMLCVLRECGLALTTNDDSELRRHIEQTGEVPVDVSRFKVIYIAPMKSLVQEMVANFGNRLTKYGVVVRELTGDANLTKQQLRETNIVVTTPEKWDILTRKAGADRTIMDAVRLIIIDEIHLLHDDRGPVLEAIVARTRRQIEASQEHVRLVGLSATLPNYEDVATFLRVDPDRGLFAFDSSFRPCPLQLEFVGVAEKKPLRRLQRMNELTYKKVMAQRAGGSNSVSRRGGDDDGNQILIFVHSRKETVKCAQFLVEMAEQEEALDAFVARGSPSKEILRTEAEEVSNKDLKSLMPNGVGIHHAGMLRSDRSLVEELFADGHLRILVSTATLAWGVNLPAHAVIIRGTEVYRPEKGRWGELSSMDVLQMLGRAGRPAFDVFGEGCLITSQPQLEFYVSLLQQQLPIESQLLSPKRLPDAVNAEVALGTIQSVSDAADWLAFTYCFVCMLRNPPLYGISTEEAQADPLLRQRRLDLAHSACVLLDKANLIAYDRRTGSIHPTELGIVASHYYVTHESMRVYNDNLKPEMGDIDLLRVFSLSSEFGNLTVREEERLELQGLLERVPVPVKEASDSPAAKVNALFQAYVSRLSLSGFALIADMVYIQQSAGRLTRALFALALSRGWAQLALRCLQLAQEVDWRQWGAQHPLRQLNHIAHARGSPQLVLPEEVIRRLERRPADVSSMSRLALLNVQELGDLVSFPQLGGKLQQMIAAFPKLGLSPRIRPLTRSLLHCEVTITPEFEFDSARWHSRVEPFWILVTDADGEAILHSQPFLLKEEVARRAVHEQSAGPGTELTVDFTLPIFEPLHPQYHVRIISDRWLGCGTSVAVGFRHLLLPDAFPPATPVHDLQPVRFSDFHHPVLETRLREVYGNTATDGEPIYLNSLQSQAYSTLFDSNNNCFLGIPAGCGREFMGSLAVCRALLQHGTKAKVLYISPVSAAVTQRFEEWDKLFGEGTPLNMRVAMLDGSSAAENYKIIQSSQLTVCTAEQWEVVSRRWRQRKALHRIKLFVVDHLHVVGTHAQGAALEVGVARARCMAVLLNQAVGTSIRFAGISGPIANYDDVADWLGCTSALPGPSGKRGEDSPGVFNFPPSARPWPLQVSLTAFENPHFGARIHSMSRPLLLALRRHAFTEAEAQGTEAVLKPRSVIVFVPNNKAARAVARDLVAAFSETDERKRWRRCRLSDLDDFVARVKNPILKETLPYGISLIHGNLSDADRAIAEHLFIAGAAQILVVTRELAWGGLGPVSRAGLTQASGVSQSISAPLVVIYGTQYYDAQQRRYADYSAAEVQEMCGFCTDRLCFFVYAPRKDYYKKFLFASVPCESALASDDVSTDAAINAQTALADALNAEICADGIANKQDAVDWLTWTLVYRRLRANPNAYGLTGRSDEHIADWLSELVENTLADLREAGCIAIADDDFTVTALNLGVVAGFYAISHATVELFGKALRPQSALKALLDVLCASAEFDNVAPLRQGEASVLSAMARHCPIKIRGGDDVANSPAPVASKVNVLLQSHLGRRRLIDNVSRGGLRLQLHSVDLDSDTKLALALAVPRLLPAMIDVLSSCGWLRPALACMELVQMLHQAVWDSKSDPHSLLKQLPHFADHPSLLDSCDKNGVSSVYDFMEMEDEARAKLLASVLSEKQIGDVAEACNRFPALESSFSVFAEHDGEDDSAGTDGVKRISVHPGDPITVRVRIARDIDEDEEVGPAILPFFPTDICGPRFEQYWVVVGEVTSNTLFGLKRVPSLTGRSATVDVEMAAPTTPGLHSLTLFLMCDTYLGSDEDFSFEVIIQDDTAMSSELMAEQHGALLDAGMED